MRARSILVGLLSVAMISAVAWAGAHPEKQERTGHKESANEAVKQKKPIAEFEVEVVGKRPVAGTRITRYAMEVTTLSKDQIKDLGALDALSSLRTVPGVNISRFNLVGSYGGKSGGAFTIRGIGSSRPGGEVMTMLDGIPLFAGVWTHPIMDVISFDIADRVDVYKGPQPVLFGNVAFGAIDIIPKRRHQAGVRESSRLVYGSFDTLSLVLEHGGKSEDFDWYLLASDKKSAGHRPQADGRLQTGFGRIGYRLSSHWDASVIFYGTRSWAQDPGRTDEPLPKQGKFKVRNQTCILHISNSHEWTEGSLRLYANDGTINWEQYDYKKPEPFNTVTDYRNYGVKLRQRLHLWEKGEVVLAFDDDVYWGRATEERPSGDRVHDRLRFEDTASALAVSHLFGEKGRLWLIPSAGARLTQSKYFGHKFSPQAGLVIGYHKTTLHASFAKAYIPPGIYAAVLYQDWHGGDEWKQLRPERLRHTEVGVAQRLSEWCQVSLTAFWDYGRDRLEFVKPPPPPPHFENIGAYHIRGFELASTFQPTDDIGAFLAATYLHTTPWDLPNSPKWTASAGLDYRIWRELRLNADAEYESKRYVSNPRFPTSSPDRLGSFFVVNARISYKFQPRTRKAGTSIFVGCENLFSRHFEYRKGYPMPGATVLAGIEAWF